MNHSIRVVRSEFVAFHTRFIFHIHYLSAAQFPSRNFKAQKDLFHFVPDFGNNYGPSSSDEGAKFIFDENSILRVCNSILTVIKNLLWEDLVPSAEDDCLHTRYSGRFTHTRTGRRLCNGNTAWCFTCVDL